MRFTEESSVSIAISVVAERNVHTADQRADHVVDQCRNGGQQSEDHHFDNREDGDAGDHGGKGQHVLEIETACIKTGAAACLR